MGLDMYLTRKIYIGAEYEHRNVTGKIQIKINGNPVKINFNKVSYIEESVAYWRKANQVHKWFVENVQNGVDDCGNYYVSSEQLKELSDLCKDVLSKSIVIDDKIENGQRLENGEWQPILEDGKRILNSKEIAEILPNQSGFFFGSTEYDSYYLDDLKNTVEMLEPLLVDNTSDFYYSSSW